MTDPIREAFERWTGESPSWPVGLSIFTAGWKAGRADLLAEQEAAGPVVKFSPQVAFTQPTVNKIGDMPRLQPRVVLDDAQPAITDQQWKLVRARIGSSGLRRGRPARTLFGGLMVCGLCGGAIVAVDARRYGCAGAKDRGRSVCEGIGVDRKAVDQRLLSLVRDELLAPSAIAAMRASIARMTAERDRVQAAAQRAGAARTAEIDREIANLVDTIARMGGSTALETRLQALEAERMTLHSSEQAIEAPRGGIQARAVFAAYRRNVMDLQHAIEADRDKARRLIATLIGPIRVAKQGAEVWAELEMTEPARLLVAGSPLNLVAGARCQIWKRVRIV